MYELLLEYMKYRHASFFLLGMAKLKLPIAIRKPCKIPMQKQHCPQGYNTVPRRLPESALEKEREEVVSVYNHAYLPQEPEIMHLASYSIL